MSSIFTFGTFGFYVMFSFQALIALISLMRTTNLGQGLTIEMNNCKNSMELLKIRLLRNQNLSHSEKEIITSELSYLSSKLGTKSAINPQSLFQLTETTGVSALATLLS